MMPDRSERWAARILGLIVAVALISDSRTVLADAGKTFSAVTVSDVRLYSFMIETGDMIPVSSAWARDDGSMLTSKAFAFPLDRHFVIGLKLRIEPDGSSGYRLPENDAVHVVVGGRARHAWRDFYLHGQTFTDGIQSKVAFAWKFVTLDLVCDPLDVDVRFRGMRLKRIRIVGQCPE